MTLTRTLALREALEPLVDVVHPRIDTDYTLTLDFDDGAVVNSPVIAPREKGSALVGVEVGQMGGRSTAASPWRRKVAHVRPRGRVR